MLSSTANRPVQEGRQERKRVLLTPDTEPTAGDEVVMTIEPSAMADLFLNEPSEAYVLSFTWPATSEAAVVIAVSRPPPPPATRLLRPAAETNRASPPESRGF